MTYQVLEVQIFQTLGLDGLSQASLTPVYVKALIAAYIATFPELNATNIVFGTVVASVTETRRRLGDNSLAIPVAIKIPTSETNSVAAGLSGTSFAGNITQELESAGESTLSVGEQDATGMEVLLSVKAETTKDIEDSIINNQNFASDFTAQAISNGIVGPMAFNKLQPTFSQWPNVSAQLCSQS